MSARIFFAGAAVGAVVGALAVSVLRLERSATWNPDEATQAAARDDVLASARTSPTPAVTSPGTARSSASDPPANARATAATTSVTDGHAVSAWPDPDEDILQSIVEQWEETPSIGQLRDKMKAEARDDVWASNMETKLTDYLARRPIPNALGSVSVQCRMTICRVISVANDQVHAAVPYTDLQAAIMDLLDDSLGRELAYLTTSVGVLPNNSTQVIQVSFLRRADVSSDSQS